MRLRSRFKSRKGGAAVELAVLFPIILLILIGIVDYGRVFYSWVQVSNAARAGAEWGGQGPGYDIATDSMRKIALADGIDTAAVTDSASYFCECNMVANPSCGYCGGGVAPEVYTTVVISKTVNMFLSYPGLPGTVTISRTARFRSQ